jgi:surfeit locus 1 family protein
MARFRPRLWPTLFSLPVFLLCLGLGSWQVDRLAWKRGLIAQRAAAVAAAPVPPPDSLAAARGLEFHPIAVTGRFLHDREIHLGATSPGGVNGYQVLTPLREADGRLLLVNRGFVPASLRDPEKRAAGEIAGPVALRGLLRLPPQQKPGWFLPDNRPDLNYWFWVDLGAIASATGLPDLAPYYIDADATANPGGWPKGGVTRLDLPNDHLQYAITWFSLAIALLVIYVIYHIRNPDPA